MSAKITIKAIAEDFKIRGTFTISRGSKTVAHVVTCIVTDVENPSIIGRGESLPYPHYGESVEGTIAQIEKVAPQISVNPSRELLLTLLPPNAARNALDCALWDYEAKKSGKRVWELAKMPKPPRKLETAFTLSLDTVEKMAEKARENSHRPLLKLKVGSPEDLAKVRAVREAAPKSRLVIDANEGWTPEITKQLVPELVKLGVELAEQPLPAGKDLEALRGLRFDGCVLCADESMRGKVEDLDQQALSYQAVNIKLDKTGGLTHAIAIAKRARELGMKIMMGCMVSTSLSMAPAAILAAGYDAEWVDLDGPLLLAEDRENPLHYEGSIMFPPEPTLWG